MTAAERHRRQRDQLALVADQDTAHGHRTGPVAPEVPAPRSPRGRELRAAPELGAAPGREVDRWRISGRGAPVLTPFSATACTGNAGLCGVCTGGPCPHDLEHDQDQPDESEQQEHSESERELEDEDEDEDEDEEIEP